MFVSLVLFACLLVCLFVWLCGCACLTMAARAATHPRRDADGQVCVVVCVCLFAGTPTAEFLCLNCDTFSVLTDRASLDHTGA